MVINDRYQIVRSLGKGGMGEVFEVQDKLRPELNLALKVVIEDAPEIFREKLGQEFEVLADLAHVGLPRVYDFDTIRSHGPKDGQFESLKIGSPMLIRALVEGESLDQWAKGVERAEKLAALAQVSAILAYLHDQGLVYRDLKPENILVNGRGAEIRVKLLDFGLTVDHQAVDARSGTPEYLAPEVLRGEEAQAAADLYALGVVAYEILSGAHPFAGINQTVDLIRAMLNTSLSLDFLAEGPLRTHLESLLSLDAEARPQSGWITWQLLKQASEAAAEGQALPQIPVALDARLVGRHGELDRLLARVFELKNAQMGLGASTLARGFCEIITGPPGSGKSRLFRRVQAQIRVGGLRCFGEQVVSPAGEMVGQVAWRRLFADLLRRRRSQKQTPYLSLLEKALSSERMDWHMGLTPQVAQERLYEAGLALLAEEARAESFVIIFEDLQSLDLESLEWFERMAKEVPDGLALFATSWPPGPTAEAIGRVRDRLAEGVQWHALHGLEGDEVAQYVRRLTGDQPDGAFVSRLKQHTDGNPLFLGELLRGAKSLSALAESLDDEGFPRVIGEASRLQLARLSDAVVACLGALATLGVPSSLADLAHVLAQGEGAIQPILDEALTARLIWFNDGRYWFSHSVLARISADLSDEDCRQSWHDRAARLLEKHDDDPAMLKRRAHHLIGANHLDEARELAYGAAKKAEARYAWALAVELYRIVLSLIDPTSPEHALNQWRSEARLARISMWSGRYDRAEKALSQLLSRDLPEGLDWDGPDSPTRLHSLRGQLATRTSNYEGALSHFAKGLEVARSALGAAEILDHMAEVQLRQGQAPECEKACERALERLGEIQAPELRGSIAYHQGRCAQERSDYVAALSHFKRAQAFYDAADDVRGAASVLGAVAWVYEVQNQGEEAVKAHENSLKMMERAGDVEGIANTLQRLGLCHYMQGDAQEAALHLERSVELYRQLRDSQGVGRVLNALGVLHHIRGAYQDAIECRKEAMDHQIRLGDVAGLAMSRASLAILYLEIGALDVGAKMAQMALEVTEKFGQRFRNARCHQIMGNYHRLIGEKAPAESHLLSASEIFADLNSGEALSTAKASLAENAFRFGEHDRAKTYADEAAELARSLGQPVILQAQVVRARVYLADPTSDTQLVADALDEALDIATKLNYADFLWQVFELQGRLAIRRLRPMEACRWLSKAMDIVFACHEQLPDDLKEIYVADPRRQMVRNAFQVALRRASRGGRRRGGRPPTLKGQ